MNNEDLKNFKGFDIEVEYQKVMDHYAEACRLTVINNSPEKRGNYKSGWVASHKKTKNGYQIDVWNEKSPNLTHLLENGHQIVNKIGGVGWASGDHHIQNSFNEIKSEYINAMENVKVKFK